MNKRSHTNASNSNSTSGREAVLAVVGLCLVLTLTALWGDVDPPAVMIVFPDDLSAIRAVQQRKGRVFADEYGRVIRILWQHQPITDDDLRLLFPFQHLETLSIRAASKHGPGISNAGLKHLAELPNLHWLDVSVNPHITDDGLAPLQRLSRLEHLDLSGTRITNAGLPLLGRMTQLTSLNLSSTRINNDGLEHLQPLAQLRHLTLPYVGRRIDGGWTDYGCTPEGLPALWRLPIEQLDGISISRRNVQYLQGFSQLREWDGMRHETFHDTDLVYLRKMSQLTSLPVHLTDGWQNTSRLRLLSAFPQLESLSLSAARTESTQVDGIGLATLARFPKLTELHLSRIPETGLQQFPALPALRTLDLTGSGMTGEGLSALTRFPRLESLSLDRRTVTAAGLAHLPEMTTLTKLHLDGTVRRDTEWWSRRGFPWRVPSVLTDEALQALERVPNLQELSLWEVPIGDAALAHLRHVPQLRTLILSGSKVTDNGLNHLRFVPDLQHLHLQNLPVTDAAFVFLRRLDQLEALSQHGSKITFEAAGAFYRDHPNCSIDDNWCCGCMSFIAQSRLIVPLDSAPQR